MAWSLQFNTVTTKQHSIRFKVHWKVTQHKQGKKLPAISDSVMQNWNSTQLHLKSSHSEYINYPNMTKGQEHLHKSHKQATSEKSLHDNCQETDFHLSLPENATKMARIWLWLLSLRIIKLYSHYVNLFITITHSLYRMVSYNKTVLKILFTV